MRSVTVGVQCVITPHLSGLPRMEWTFRICGQGTGTEDWQSHWLEWYSLLAEVDIPHVGTCWQKMSLSPTVEAEPIGYTFLTLRSEQMECIYCTCMGSGNGAGELADGETAKGCSGVESSWKAVRR